MPGCRCAVFSCSNSRVVTKAKGRIVIYHSFPKGNDSVSAATRKEWIRRCKRADKWNPSTSHICSEHFIADDYERDLQNELLGLPTRKKLKKTAVPTVNIPLATLKSQPENNPRRQRAARRQRRREVQEILNNSSQAQPTNSKICKDLPQIELIMCDDLPLAVVENQSEDIQKQRQRKVQDILANGLQPQPTNSEICKDSPQIELIMCDDLPPVAVENHPEGIQNRQRFARIQRPRVDQDTSNNSSRSQSTISQISEDSPVMYDEKISMESNYQELLRKYIKLEMQYKLLQSSSQRKIKLLSDQVCYYENKFSKLRSRGKPNLILVKRKCNRKPDGQSFKEKEMQLLHLIDKEDSVCCKISNRHLKIDNQNRILPKTVVTYEPCESVKIEPGFP